MTLNPKIPSDYSIVKEGNTFECLLLGIELAKNFRCKFDIEAVPEPPGEGK